MAHKHFFKSTTFERYDPAKDPDSVGIDPEEFIRELRKQQEIQIEDYIDVSAPEKKLMLCWNKIALETGRGHMPDYLKASDVFVSRHRSELEKDKDFFHAFLIHLMVLQEMCCITREDVKRILSTLSQK